MWVVYHKAAKKIVGLTANTDLDVDKDTAVREVVEGLLEKGPLQEYEAILVQEKEKAAEYMAVFPDKLVVSEGDAGLRVVIREPESFSLHLTCDAKDKHPVDGIPLIPADGTSYTTVTVLKIDERSAPQRDDRHKDVLYLRTDHGTIRDAEGKKEIGSIQLHKGGATFRLVSEPIKRVATIQILSANPALPSVDFRVEFT